MNTSPPPAPQGSNTWSAGLAIIVVVGLVLTATHLLCSQVLQSDFSGRWLENSRLIAGWAYSVTIKVAVLATLVVAVLWYRKALPKVGVSVSNLGRIFLGAAIASVAVVAIALVDTILPGWSDQYRSLVDWAFIKVWFAVVVVGGITLLFVVGRMLYNDKRVKAFLEENEAELLALLQKNLVPIILIGSGILLVGIILMIWIF